MKTGIFMYNELPTSQNEPKDLCQIRKIWKIDENRFLPFPIWALRGVLGVFWGCLCEGLSMYEGFRVNFAILAVSEACGEVF